MQIIYIILSSFMNFFYIILYYFYHLVFYSNLNTILPAQKVKNEGLEIFHSNYCKFIIF